MHITTKQVWIKGSLVVCLALVLFLVIEVVSAQDATSATNASPTIEATTTSAVVSPASAWYSSDFISGDIEVGDFVIGPGKVEVTIKPGESVTRNISVTNRISDKRGFSLAVEDMSGSANPSEAVVLLGDQNGPYSLRDYLSFPNTEFTLALGERAQIPVTITMPPNAEPGGYYGAVLVSTIQSAKTSENASVSTPVVARVGTLFFITVPGASEKSGAMTDFSTIPNKFIFSRGPITMGILFENTGSIHLGPYGEVKVQNLLGEEVGFVEIEPWFVLPKSLRLREVTWDREMLLGRYTITAKINRGYDDIIDEKTMHIWVLPWQFLVSVFLGVLLLTIFIKFIGSRFEFKRKR